MVELRWLASVPLVRFAITNMLSGTEGEKLTVDGY
jgi:hypothetical protein